MKQQPVTRRLLEVMNKVIASDFEPDINTQADFAAALGVHPSAISRMLAGTADATIEHLVTICTRFKVSGNYLLLGKGDVFLPGAKMETSEAKLQHRIRELTDKVDVIIASIHNEKNGTKTRNKNVKTALKRTAVKN